MGKLFQLYPTGIDDMTVVPRLPVPRFPGVVAQRNLSGVRKFYGERLLAEFDVADTEDRIGIIDKLLPHARYDTMILATNDEARTASTDLAPNTLTTILEMAYVFVRYTGRPDIAARFGLDDAEIHMSFNYDRDTTDRENAMFYDKRFHLHLNCWPGEDLRAVEGVRFGAVPDPVLRLRLVDPVAFLAARIISEATGGSIGGRRLTVTRPGDGISAPIGLCIGLEGWDALRDSGVPQVLTTLHTVAQDAYSQVRAALVGTSEPSEPWTRPSLLPRDAIASNLRRLTWLSEEVRHDLYRLALMLRDITPQEMSALRDDPERAVSTMTMAGLDYSIGFFKPFTHASESAKHGSPIFLTMQCRLFGDIGGAGLPPLRGIGAVRLDRKSGSMLSEQDVRTRTDFLAGYRAAVTDALGDTLISRSAV